MQRIKLSAGGPDFSQIILGAWRWCDGTMGLDELEKLVDTSLELGITTIDHADIYGNYGCEEFHGELLSRRPDLRVKLEIITKCGIKPVSSKYPDRKLGTYDTGKEHIVRSAENSLKKLNVDHIDLLLIHRSNPLMDPDEISEAFLRLRESGKVLHFGVSNFTNEQFSLLQSRMEIPLVTNQLEVSLSFNTPAFDGTLDYLHERHIHPLAWSPLGGGDIFSHTGLMDSLSPLCIKYGVEMSALLLAWLLKLPSGILPIAGTTRPDRLTEMARSAEVILERQDWFMMLRSARGHDVP